jgi:hypothetical protein
MEAEHGTIVFLRQSMKTQFAMSITEPRIISFLATLKTEGRSSPCDWHRFYEFLAAKRLPNKKAPPVPMILAASDESDASKHRRLGERLEWALENKPAYQFYQMRLYIAPRLYELR